MPPQGVTLLEEDESSMRRNNVSETADESFISTFTRSKGPPQVILLGVLLALGFGSTIGVIPVVMTDRYARLHHGYELRTSCADYPLDDKPQACRDGSADAQAAVAYEQLVSNAFTFFTSSFIGSLSDEYGRKGIMSLGILLACLSPLCLVLLQLDSNMSPNWYYVASSLSGLINWSAVSFSAVADVMPPKWRAPSFGLLLAGYSMGFAVAPGLALLLGYWRVSLMSLSCVILGFILTLCFLPETLPPEVAARARIARREASENMRGTFWMLYRPIWELSILNRNTLLRLLAALAFFSGVVSSGDQNLLLYYIEEWLGFNDQDVAVLFLILGVMGICVQLLVLKPLNDLIGERRLVMFCFAIGCLHNVIYGLATTKLAVFVAVWIGSFTMMAFPTISAIKSNNVNESEQGRIQGALYSLQALASALGPLALRKVYQYTRHGELWGPGSMFIVAGMFYAVGIVFAGYLPPEADSKYHASARAPASAGAEDDEVSSQTALV